MPEPAAHIPRLGGLAFGMEAQTQYDAIAFMAEVLSERLNAADSIRISAAAIAREALASTHIGRHTAIPHARLANMDNFLVGVGIARDPIAWGPEQSPVRIVILSVVPSSANMVYLGFMRTLMQALKNDRNAEQLLACTSEAPLRLWLEQNLNLR